MRSAVAALCERPGVWTFYGEGITKIGWPTSLPGADRRFAFRPHYGTKWMGDVLPSSTILHEEGWLRINKMSRSLRIGADGVVAHTPCLRMHSETCLVSDHPVRSTKVASQHFIDVAATPPLEEGRATSPLQMSKLQTPALTPPDARENTTRQEARPENPRTAAHSFPECFCGTGAPSDARKSTG